jgi:hypothetical protein
MRKFAIAGFVTVAMSLPFLGGTVESYASEGPWCHTFGGPEGSIENCRVRTLEECRFEIQSMVDPARRIRFTTDLSPKDGQPVLAGFIRGRGGKMVQLSD